MYVWAWVSRMGDCAVSACLHGSLPRCCLLTAGAPPPPPSPPRPRMQMHEGAWGVCGVCAGVQEGGTDQQQQNAPCSPPRSLQVVKWECPGHTDPQPLDCPGFKFPVPGGCAGGDGGRGCGGGKGRDISLHLCQIFCRHLPELMLSVHGDLLAFSGYNLHFAS